jgi:GNAT superfamily N-acetyltransferase
LGAQVALSVRIASDVDVTALATLRRAWNEENLGGPIHDPHFNAAFSSWWKQERATRTFFLAEVDGLAIGMANVKRFRRMPTAGRPSSHWGYVGNVFIREGDRNGGHGEALMHHIVTWALSEEFAHLRLAPSILSRRFYARLGFLAGEVVQLDLVDS